MTCCIAIPVPKAGKTVLGAGSRITQGYSLCPPANKIFNVGSGWHAAMAGELAVMQRVAVALRGDWNADTLGRLVKESAGADGAVEMILARGTDVVLVDGDGAILMSSDVQAVGDCGSLAVGFACASKTPATVAQARALAKRALQFVATRSVSEGPPYKTKAV